jgi:AraC family transcriptional regulator of adaptative response / DNA-3-methyladenine glycosylase II
VLGQQVSVAGAATLAARLVAACGRPVSIADETLTHVFPDPPQVMTAEDEAFSMPASRRRALQGLAAAAPDGELELHAGADRDAARAALMALPGIGEWTATYVAMRVFGDPDAFLVSDLGVRRALERLGQAGDPASATARAERWRPWRAYALMYLWSALATPDSGAAPRRPHVRRPWGVPREEPALAAGAR